MEVVAAVNTLNEHTDLLAARVISAETAHRALASDSQRVLNSVIEQSRHEFIQQAESANTLRVAIAQESTSVRQQLEITQKVVEEIHGGATSEFQALRGCTENSEHNVAQLGRMTVELQSTVYGLAQQVAQLTTQMQQTLAVGPPGRPATAAGPQSSWGDWGGSSWQDLANGVDPWHRQTHPGADPWSSSAPPAGLPGLPTQAHTRSRSGGPSGVSPVGQGWGGP